MTDGNHEKHDDKLAWHAPRLEALGTIDDVRKSQPPNDNSGSPSLDAS